MAEGWAKDWVSQQKQDLERLMERGGANIEAYQERQFNLKNMVITSVALDSKAVFCGDVPEIRKAVKGKAVEAMLLDGIDISEYAPKTLSEIIPILSAPDIYVAAESEADHKIDRLVILCSCGDEVKRALVERSKHTDEWDIPAPTAAAKAGEGDAAYRRVSLQIRDEVNKLMTKLCA
jgi:protein-tyrosine-phosphatase